MSSPTDAASECLSGIKMQRCVQHAMRALTSAPTSRLRDAFFKAVQNRPVLPRHHAPRAVGIVCTRYLRVARMVRPRFPSHASWVLHALGIVLSRSTRTSQPSICPVAIMVKASTEDDVDIVTR